VIPERAAELVRLLALEPHPEGGHFRQIHRSAHRVPGFGGAPRAAMTQIYFLLAAGERSRWHRVASDEVWHFYEGSPLDLLTIDPTDRRLGRHRLGAVGGGTVPTLVVPAATWQAARSTGAYTLAGCTVAPGFEFADFELLADCGSERKRFVDNGVDLGDLL
jgi:uncharacterized protein